MMELKDTIQEEIKTLACFFNNDAFDVHRAIQHYNGEVFLCTFTDPGIDGLIMLDEKNNAPKIYILEDAPPRRRRFTMAHELGHYLSYKCGSLSKAPLEEGEILERGLTTPLTFEERQMEREANEIAAELLMPVERIERFIKEKLSVMTMAYFFQVSEQALLVRLDRLGYCVV